MFVFVDAWSLIAESRVAFADARRCHAPTSMMGTVAVKYASSWFSGVIVTVPVPPKVEAGKATSYWFRV